MSLRVAFTSDLHVEYHLEVVGAVAEEAARRAPDVLVLVGDVCPELARLEASLRLITRRLRCPVLFLPGNHELWCGGGRGRGPDSRERYERVLPELCRRAGAVPLGLAPVRVGEVAFVGVTGWHDGSLAEPGGADGADARVKPVRPRDDDEVCWPDPSGRPWAAPEIAQWMADRLREQLAGLADHPGPVVVTTHVLPHADLLGESPGPELLGIAPYLGSAALWPVISSHPGVARVLCGHHHQPAQRAVAGPHGEILCDLSPVGYPRECAQPLEDHVASRLRVIEIV